ncbi:MAG TPA: ATP-binding cassette domain-containing protein, partial [Desulfobacterales bacterium]|nr:ATP-binding cassette domain-containing protein [Desulfobacterales bacterium]
MGAALLEIRDLSVQFFTYQGVVRALEGVSLSVAEGEILGLVGETGCGKSVLARAVLRVIAEPPGKITAGRVLFKGRDLLALDRRQMRRIRGNEISMIFQEPMSSLNPVYTVGFQIEEVLRKHRGMSAAEARAEAAGLLGLVGMPEPAAR